MLLLHTVVLYVIHLSMRANPFSEMCSYRKTRCERSPETQNLTNPSELKLVEGCVKRTLIPYSTERTLGESIFRYSFVCLSCVVPVSMHYRLCLVRVRMTVLINGRIFFWPDSRQWTKASSFTRFLDHTQRRTQSVGLLWTSD